jgi:peroxiredoxin
MATSTPLEEGTDAPEFTAPLVGPDGTTRSTSLSGLLEDGAVLLVFYTNDFSPDCVKEWCSFRDYSWFTADPRFQVVGSSKSRQSTHRRFIERLDLPFPLLSDADLSVAEAFGVDYRAFGLVRRPRRSCFLIDRDRTVRYRWLGEHWIDPTRAIPDLDELQGAIDEALGGFEPETFGFSGAVDSGGEGTASH